MVPTKLRTLRRRAGFTQEQLADAAHLSKYAVGNIESHRTGRPHPATMQRIAAVLGVDIEAVYEFEMPDSEVIPRRSRSRPERQTT